MRYISFAKLHRRLRDCLDEVGLSQRPLVVKRRHANAVVILSLQEYESMEETLHLLRHPANAEHLLRSIAEANASRLAEDNTAD